MKTTALFLFSLLALAVLVGCNVEAGQSKLKETAERMCEKREGAMGFIFMPPSTEWMVVCGDDTKFQVSADQVYDAMKAGELVVLAAFDPAESEESE